MNALQLGIWCSWCLFQGLVCRNPELSPKGCIPVPAQSFVFFSCQHDLTLLGVAGTSATSHKGKVQWAWTSRMDGGVCICAVGGADSTLGMGVESGWQQPADIPCGELLGLERRQLGIVSKIPCALYLPLKLCFLWHTVPIRGQCWDASSTHASRDPELSNCRSNHSSRGAEGGRQVQKGEAALPRLNTKPYLETYNLGFEAWVLSAALQLSLHWALVKGKWLKCWESCSKREKGVRVIYPVWHWDTMEAKDWGSMSVFPWQRSLEKAAYNQWPVRAEVVAGLQAGGGCRVEMLAVELLFHWVVLLLCCWGAE